MSFNTTGVVPLPPVEGYDPSFNVTQVAGAMAPLVAQTVVRHAPLVAQTVVRHIQDFFNPTCPVAMDSNPPAIEVCPVEPIELGEGLTYEGEVDPNDRPHGHGVLTDSDGTSTEGEFHEGKLQNGEATIKFSDGIVYEGAIKDGFPHGHGVRTDSVGTVIEGEFKNGVLSRDNVTMSFENRDRYVGPINSDLKFHGEGRLEQNDGTAYSGTFANNNLQDGQVTVWYHNGDVYEGEMVNGQKHGIGIVTKKNGDWYKAEWQNDRKVKKIEANTKWTFVEGASVAAAATLLGGVAYQEIQKRLAAPLQQNHEAKQEAAQRKRAQAEENAVKKQQKEAQRKRAQEEKKLEAAARKLKAAEEEKAERLEAKKQAEMLLKQRKEQFYSSIKDKPNLIEDLEHAIKNTPVDTTKIVGGWNLKQEKNLLERLKRMIVDKENLDTLQKALGEYFKREYHETAELRDPFNAALRELNRGLQRTLAGYGIGFHQAVVETTTIRLAPLPTDDDSTQAPPIGTETPDGTPTDETGSTQTTHFPPPIGTETPDGTPTDETGSTQTTQSPPPIGTEATDGTPTDDTGSTQATQSPPLISAEPAAPDEQLPLPDTLEAGLGGFERTFVDELRGLREELTLYIPNQESDLELEDQESDLELDDQESDLEPDDAALENCLNDAIDVCSRLWASKYSEFVLKELPGNPGLKKIQENVAAAVEASFESDEEVQSEVQSYALFLTQIKELADIEQFKSKVSAETMKLLVECLIATFTQATDCINLLHNNKDFFNSEENKELKIFCEARAQQLKPKPVTKAVAVPAPSEEESLAASEHISFTNFDEKSFIYSWNIEFTREALREFQVWKTQQRITADKVDVGAKYGSRTCELLTRPNAEVIFGSMRLSKKARLYFAANTSENEAIIFRAGYHAKSSETRKLGLTAGKLGKSSN